MFIDHQALYRPESYVILQALTESKDNVKCSVTRYGNYAGAVGFTGSCGSSDTPLPPVPPPVEVNDEEKLEYTLSISLLSMECSTELQNLLDSLSPSLKFRSKSFKLYKLQNVRERSTYIRYIEYAIKTQKYLNTLSVVDESVMERLCRILHDDGYESDGDNGFCRGEYDPQYITLSEVCPEDLSLIHSKCEKTKSIQSEVYIPTLTLILIGVEVRDNLDIITKLLTLL